MQLTPRTLARPESGRDKTSLMAHRPIPEILNELIAAFREAADEEIETLLDEGTVQWLFPAMFDSQGGEPRLYIDRLLQNRNRATLIATLHQFLELNYAVQGRVGERVGYVSPYPSQWFDEGVMFLEGPAPFEGVIGLYRNGEVGYAVLAHDTRPGDALTSDDFEFVPLEQVNARNAATFPDSIEQLNAPSDRLRELLVEQTNDEARYQQLLEAHPWVLGAHYTRIQRHTHLDDRNVPDFTGVRSRDGYRDLLEIKPPFMPVYRQDGEFSAEFNAAWNQAERYLHFARTEADYLRRRGLEFDAPRCVLLAGYGLTDEQVRRLRVKEQLNPAIEILTYNDLERYMRSTAELIKRIRVGPAAAG